MLMRHIRSIVLKYCELYDFLLVCSICCATRLDARRRQHSDRDHLRRAAGRREEHSAAADGAERRRRTRTEREALHPQLHSGSVLPTSSSAHHQHSTPATHHTTQPLARDATSLPPSRSCSTSLNTIQNQFPYIQIQLSLLVLDESIRQLLVRSWPAALIVSHLYQSNCLYCSNSLTPCSYLDLLNISTFIHFHCYTLFKFKL